VKNLVWATLGMVIGLAFVIGGLVIRGGDVTCGGEVMHRGQVCTDIGGGGGSRDYDQQRSKNERTGWIGIGIGGLFLVGGGLWLVSEIRGRRRAADATPPPQV
jgi:hypothetical protein